MDDPMQLVDGPGAEWPEERHTCHGIDENSPFKIVARGVWRPANPHTNQETGDFDDHNFRTCDYCGSIHPKDLYDLMVQHPIRLDMADWKYGWPHKFYVEGIPSPLRGQSVCRMRKSGVDKDGKPYTEKVFTIEPDNATSHCKFYTEHLQDDGFNVAGFAQLSREIWKRSGLLFIRNKDMNSKLGWRCRMPFDEELAKTISVFIDPKTSEDWLAARKS